MIIALFSGCIFAADIQINGYYEHTFQVDYTEEVEEAMLDASKLRLDFDTGKSSDQLRFKGNVNFLVYHGPITRDVRPYLPKSIVNQMEQFDVPTTITFDPNRIYVDNAYLSWKKNSFRIRAGKQQLSWGPAYSSNPTDLFHRKNILDPTYEKEGVTAIRLDYYWGIGGQLSLIAAPDDDLETTGYAVRIGTHISAIGYDVALTLHEVTDSTAVNVFKDGLIRKQRRRAVGLEFSGELLGLGAWFEGNYNTFSQLDSLKEEDDFIRAVAGIDYTLENGLYVILEGQYNGRGEDEKPYPLENWIENIFFGEPVSQVMFMAGLRHDLTDLLNGSIYGFGGLDGGYVINPRLDYSLAQNADLTIFSAMTFGDDESQFPPGLYSLTARATVYF